MSDDLNRPTGTPGAPKRVLSDADLDLPIQGFKGTPEEIERQWFEKIYTGRGDTQKQLTLRAVLMGGVLGMFMSISNLYTTLKLGWAFGVAITACVLSYRDLEWPSRALGRPAEPDDHARKQLHAVHRHRRRAIPRAARSARPSARCC